KNWRIHQPIVASETGFYVNLAEELRPELDAYAAFIQDRLGVEIKFSAACVKEQDSANRKLLDTTIVGFPDRIGDYLRITGTIKNAGHESVGELDAVISYLRGAPEILGYKDQFSHPDKESGFRSFKGRVLIEDPHDPQKRMLAEMLIEHEGMKKANACTKSLRDMDRALQQMDSGFKTLFGIATSSVTQARAGINQARKLIHDTVASDIGLNHLISDDSGYHSLLNKEEPIKTMHGSMHGVRRQVKKVLENALGRS
ncbi:MAG: hypothetical protein AAGB32_05895, partial [Pseudomonadota bacterium]